MTNVRKPAEALGPLLERLSDGASALADLRPRVEAEAPWPLSDSIGVEPEAHWGPPEVLAHVAEMLPFWLGEIERVLAASPEPVPFGRVASDSIRIAVIDRDRTLPLRELFARIDADLERYKRRLGQLADAEATKRGLHPTRGELSIPEILERFVAGHLEEHIEQLREALKSAR